MKNSYHVISQILKGFWAIDSDVAQGYLPLINNLISGNVAPSADGNGLQGDGDDISYCIDRENKIISEIQDATPYSIAVINIVGPLMKYDQEDMCTEIAGMQTIGNIINEAKQNQNISAIILRIDSPGGTVDGTEQLHKIVKECVKVKPIVVHVSGMLCSAAYWIASAGSEIITENNTDIIGSIGVMLTFQDFEGMYEMMGVKTHIINADQSKDKNRDITDAKDDNYDLIKKNMLNPIAEVFINSVKANRKKILPEQLTGMTYLAMNCLGTLVDAIGDYTYALQRARTLGEKTQTFKIINN